MVETEVFRYACNRRPIRRKIPRVTNHEKLVGEAFPILDHGFHIKRARLQSLAVVPKLLDNLKAPGLTIDLLRGTDSKKGP